MEELRRTVLKLQGDHNIPQVVVDDVLFRMNDWLQSGGTKHDHYIEQQFDYVKRFVSYNIKVKES